MVVVLCPHLMHLNLRLAILVLGLGLGERFGSGDGELKTLLTRQIAFEPLPASVLFALVTPLIIVIVLTYLGTRRVR